MFSMSMLKKPKLAGMTLIEMIIGIGLFAILAFVIARGLSQLSDQNRSGDFKAVVERTFGDIDRHIRTELQKTINNPPILRADWPPPTPDPYLVTDPDPRFFFSGQFSEAFPTCNYLLLRSRYVGQDDVSTFGITELRTLCTDGLGKPASYYAGIDPVNGACPPANPRPVFVIRHWQDEYDYNDPPDPMKPPFFERFFPPAMPPSATQINRSTASPYGVQVCFGFTPPYDAAGDPNWTVEATLMERITVSINIAYPSKGEDKLEVYRQYVEFPAGVMNYQYISGGNFRYNLRGVLNNIRR